MQQKKGNGRQGDDAAAHAAGLAPLASAERPLYVPGSRIGTLVAIAAERLDPEGIGLSLSLAGPGDALVQHMLVIDTPDPACGDGGSAAIPAQAGHELVAALVRLKWLDASPDWELVEVARGRIRDLL